MPRPDPLTRRDWPNEKALVNATLKALRDRGAWAEKIHGGIYQRAGLPDITGVYQGFRFDLEAKLPGEKPTALQNACLEELQRHGSVAYVIFTVQDALDALAAIQNRIAIQNVFRSNSEIRLPFTDSEQNT